VAHSQCQGCRKDYEEAETLSALRQANGIEELPNACPALHTHPSFHPGESCAFCTWRPEATPTPSDPRRNWTQAQFLKDPKAAMAEARAHGFINVTDEVGNVRGQIVIPKPIAEAALSSCATCIHSFEREPCESCGIRGMHFLETCKELVALRAVLAAARAFDAMTVRDYPAALDALRKAMTRTALGSGDGGPNG
jgi:hypothetical protein